MQNGGAFSSFQAYNNPEPLTAAAGHEALLRALQAIVNMQQGNTFQQPIHTAQPPRPIQHQPEPQVYHAQPKALQDNSPSQSGDRASDGAAARFGQVDPKFVGVKLPIVCNDVRGMAYLDQQVVACYCDACNARVDAGHDRPLYTFTRFEGHTGSKAKKWRLSLRIEPGVVKECPPGDQPMPLGQWLELKGMLHWAPRTAIKVGVRDALGDQNQNRQLLAQAVETSRILPQKRDRETYETPDLPAQSDKTAWISDQRNHFKDAATADTAAKHAAIFRLVYGLLEAGDERRSFNEEYLPWLNETGWQRVESEFATLKSYLDMVESMEIAAVLGQMKAYIRSVVARVVAGTNLPSEVVPPPPLSA